MRERLRGAWWALVDRVMETQTPLNVALRRPWPGTLRGLALWLVALAVIAYGSLNYVATDLPDANRITLELALIILPAHVWGWVMILVGTTGLYCSYCHKGRDRWGFLVISVFCALWASFYLGGWIAFDAPLRGLSGGITWLLMSGLLVVVAGFPNVPLRWADRPGGRNWRNR